MNKLTTPFLIISLLALPLMLHAADNPKAGNFAGRIEMDLSGRGWSLWQDKDADWQKDELFLPPVDLSKIPTNAPTGGWQSLAQGIPVTVPGTAEEYLEDATPTTRGVAWWIRSFIEPPPPGPSPAWNRPWVTWWVRSFTAPKDVQGKIIRLHFESVRQRAEVYVNGKLAGYDLVGNTPFEADLTGLVQPGETVQLAVRVTNPGGNYAWPDVWCIGWGKYKIPCSHGFGGVTGGVRLVVTDPIYIDDLYLQNTPKPVAVNAIATVRNSTGRGAAGSLDLIIREKGSDKIALRKQFPNLTFKPGETVVTCPAEVPGAKLWDLDHPDLYRAEATISLDGKPVDSLAQTFGFRWFAPEGIGSNALLRLNGKRVVLRTAISWGFWPINGLFPTPELAEKQVKVAKEFGLNMLNFHRCIGNPLVFEKADELGLLYYEEPGAYTTGNTDPFAQALCREKLLRMVKRDRSHPSLVIYNMINEWAPTLGPNTDETFAVRRKDIRDAHTLDPSRTITFASSWAERFTSDPKNDPAKMHMRPFDTELHMNGWWDYHRAGGPSAAVWTQDFYTNPAKHYCYTANTSEIVYWGEEGAISAPPRLGLIEQSLRGVKNLGWDGQVYRDWYEAFDAYLTTNNLKAVFPTLDDLCKAMGVTSLEHQGRKIEDIRICDANDGYAINVWESEPIENHSGVVDCFRNPKADPSILAYYNQPLYVAVKPRQQVTGFPGKVAVDFHLINEKDLKGALTLKIRATTPDGKETFSKDLEVNVSGGDVYGQLLAEEVVIPVEHQEGFTTINASLVDAGGIVKAQGHDRIFGVEWKSIPLGGKGAVYENGSAIRNFLKTAKGMEVPSFDDTQSKLDWIVVAKPAKGDPVPIAEDILKTADGQEGVNVTFHDGTDFTKSVAQRIDKALNFRVTAGGVPDPKCASTERYAVRWEGTILPPVDGEYDFTLQFRSKVRLWLDGKQLLDEKGAPSKRQTKRFKATLAGGKPTPIRIELLQPNGDALMQLLWQTPVPEKILPEQVLARAQRDGTTVIILNRADTWLASLGTATCVPQGQAFELGNWWVGGQFFAMSHPIFTGLPVNQGLNWPYQGVLGGKRFGLDVRGGELVAGAYNSWPMKLGSAVSVVPLGRGRVMLSTLDIASQLGKPDSSAEVARRLFCNMIRWAADAKPLLPLNLPTATKPQ